MARMNHETLATRYEAGDCIAVWQELHAIEDITRLDADILQDIDVVVRETVKGAVNNMIKIYEYLAATNFDFDAPACPMPAAGDALAIIAMLRERFGTLPPLLSAWLEAVTLLFWRGKPNLEAQRWERSLIDPFEFAMTDLSVAAALKRWEGESQARSTFDLEFAGDTFQKNEMSGGASTVLRLPATTVDVRVFEDPALSSSAADGLWFVDYLRLYFAGGGFRITAVSDQGAAVGLLPLPVEGLVLI